VVAASPRAETGVAGASTGTCTDDPLTAALDFAAFVRNDVTLLGQNVLGTLAVGGKLAWTPALGVSQNDKNQSYGGVALYAAEVDWSFPGSGTLNVNGGDVALGGAYHAFTSGSWKGRVYATDAGTGKFVDAKKSVVSVASVGEIDFDARFAELEACSNLLAELPGSCSAADCAYHVQPLATDSGCTASAPYTGSGKMCLDLGSKGAQILNIPESELADITEFSHKGGLSQAHPLIITVIDDDDDQHIDFTLTTSSWQNIGNTKNVLVNFPTARTVTIDQPLFGTVLAPYAEVTTIGNVQGGVVAASWIHRSGTVNNEGNNVFDGTIDWE
jgi:choice-of-anchor A domain-containing protein